MRRSIVGVPALALVLLLVAAPSAALADSERGNVGRWSIQDSRTQPGVVCTYNESWSALQSFKVRAPQVWARDKTAGEDLQYVGWKFFIKARAAHHVRTLYVSTFQISLATDQNPAALTDVTVSPTITSFAHHFVVIKLYWFGPDGYPRGWAKHGIRNNVRVNAGDPNGAVERYCDTGYA